MSNEAIYMQIHSLYETAKNRTKVMLKRRNPKLLGQALSLTPHLTIESSIPEILFSIQNNITEFPKCMFCDSRCRWSISHSRYYEVCGNSCTFKLAALRSGVDNFSQLNSVKDSKKNTFIQRYGVLSVSQHPNTLEANRDRMFRLSEENIKIATESGQQIKNIGEYRSSVIQMTEHMYRKFKNIIDPANQRDMTFNLDHIFSVCDGFYNNVPYWIISHPVNLRIISATTNRIKSAKSDIALEILLENYTNSDLWKPTNSISVSHFHILPDNIKSNNKSILLSESNQLCRCGAKANYMTTRGTVWCTPHHNSCPSMNATKNKTRNI